MRPFPSVMRLRVLRQSLGPLRIWESVPVAPLFVIQALLQALPEDGECFGRGRRGFDAPASSEASQVEGRS